MGACSERRDPSTEVVILLETTHRYDTDLFESIYNERLRKNSIQQNLNTKKSSNTFTRGRSADSESNSKGTEKGVFGTTLNKVAISPQALEKISNQYTTV